MARIHILISDEEKERLRVRAEQEGKTMSEWLRDAAREKLAETEAPGIDTLDELRAFFRECDRRESEPEPHWAQHRKVIERSRTSGVADD